MSGDPAAMFEVNRVVLRIVFAAGSLFPMFASTAWCQRIQSQIVVLDIDTGEIRKLVVSDFRDEEPEWSPDNTLILFDSQREESRDIYVMGADGTEVRRLTESSAKEDHGSWSPDGKRIVYQREYQGNTDVFVMNADGSNQTRLTNHAARDGWPDWSPDGKQIVFSSERDGRREVYVMNADGSEQTRLTSSQHGSTDPAYSPNGKWIAFNSDRDGDSDIFAMHADGSNLRQLTDNDLHDERPDWSADGKSVVCSRTNLRKVEYSLHKVDLNGNNEQQISPPGSRLTRPHWSADGQEVLCQRMIHDGLKPTSDVIFTEFKPSMFAAYVGKYELEEAPGQFFEFTTDQGRYFGAPPGQSRVEIMPLSKSTFFPRNYPGKVTFQIADDGRVVGVTVDVGRSMKAHRVE